MKYLYNYSTLIKREKVHYNKTFGAIKLVAVGIYSACALISLIIGFILSFTPTLIGKAPVNMFSPFADNWNIKYDLIFIVIGLVIGGILYNTNVGGYQLYEYLIAYLRPKDVLYINSYSKVSSKITFYQYIIKTFMRSRL